MLPAGETHFSLHDYTRAVLLCAAPRIRLEDVLPSSSQARRSDLTSGGQGMRSPSIQYLILILSIALLASLVVWPVGAQNQSGSAAPVSAGVLDASKLPDISGLHLGIPLAESTALMKKMYPR